MNHNCMPASVNVLQIFVNMSSWEWKTTLKSMIAFTDLLAVRLSLIYLKYLYIYNNFHYYKL